MIENMIILLILGLLVIDIFAHMFLTKSRKWYHFLPFGALISALIIIVKK